MGLWGIVWITLAWNTILVSLTSILQPKSLFPSLWPQWLEVTSGKVQKLLPCVTICQWSQFLNSWYSRDKTLSKLLHCLFFVQAHYNFKIYGHHIPGSQNRLADNLSRNQLPNFFLNMPTADTTPTAVSPLLLQWLLQPTQDWTSPHWMQQFSTIVWKEYGTAQL